MAERLIDLFHKIIRRFFMIKKRKKLLHFHALICELEKLFINNPFDNPKSQLSLNDYFSLIKTAELITSYHDFTIKKDNQEWDYFTSKWSALHNFRCEEQLKNFKTNHDVFVAILENWDRLKHSPHTYRCVASLIRMLDEEQG